MPGGDGRRCTGGWPQGDRVSDQTLTDIEAQVDRLPADVPLPEHSEYRNQARRWLAATDPDSPLSQRMAVTRGYVRLLAAGVWGADETWRSDVRDIVLALRPHGDRDQEARGDQIALSAVGMALLLQEANLHGGSGADLIARSAWDVVQEWVAYAEEGDITAELVPSTRLHARVATGSE